MQTVKIPQAIPESAIITPEILLEDKVKSDKVVKSFAGINSIVSGEMVKYFPGIHKNNEKWNDMASQTVLSSVVESDPIIDNLSKKPVKKNLVPDKPISFNFKNELKWIDLLEQKIGKNDFSKILTGKYDTRLKTIFQRFIFVNKHNKKDVCMFAIRFGQLLNFIESKIKKKQQFTNWRAKVFSNVSERYVQKWQQAAKIGDLVEHFSEFGLDTVIELDYLVKRKNEKFPDVTDSEIIDTIKNYIKHGGFSTERILFRYGMDAAVTEFSLKKEFKKNNFSGMENFIVETRPLILQSVKFTGGALEESDVHKIIDNLKNMTSENDMIQFMNNYTMDKKAVAHAKKMVETKNNSKGTNEAIARFNCRFESKNIDELDLGEDEAIRAYKNLIKYFNYKNIDVNTITITKEI